MTDEDLTTLTDQDRTTRDSTRVWPAPGSVPGMTTLWHLAEPAHWAQARERGSYERSTRGASLASVGFVHCCYPEQLPGVVARFYADAAATGDYVVLELDGELLERAGSPVRDEPGNPDDPASRFSRTSTGRSRCRRSPAPARRACGTAYSPSRSDPPTDRAQPNRIAASSQRAYGTALTSWVASLRCTDWMSVPRRATIVPHFFLVTASTAAIPKRVASTRS